MHPDTKLGLALGMLVTGFAIAFCFPREPRVSPVAELVDERGAPAIPIEPIRFAVGETGDFRQETARPVGTPAEPVAPPEPLPTIAHPVPRPIGEVAAQGGAGPKSAPEAVASPSAVPVAGEQTVSYRVQQGETLSGIAARFLGSSQRYYDIYSANRDQLPTPNDLKAGMIIRIPVAGVPAPATPSQFENLAGGSVQRVIPPEEPQPTLAIPHRHVVQAGETLESIAERYFGDRSFVSVLRVANPQLTAGVPLQVGTIIELPVLRSRSAPPLRNSPQ